MSEIALLDVVNQPIAYCEDGVHVYLYSGEPVAYVFEDGLYGYHGKLLGWLGLGSVLDRSGLRACTTVPSTSLTGMPPWKGMKGMLPMQAGREWKPARPVATINGWSPLVGRAFFLQQP